MQGFQRLYSSMTPERDLPGGGAELLCSYIIDVQRQNFAELMHILEQHVGTEVLDDKIFA